MPEFDASMTAILIVGYGILAEAPRTGAEYCVLHVHKYLVNHSMNTARHVQPERFAGPNHFFSLEVWDLRLCHAYSVLSISLSPVMRTTPPAGGVYIHAAGRWCSAADQGGTVLVR